jgi:hypothetical protein
VVAYAADQPERIKLTLRVEVADRETVLGAVSGLEGLDLLHAWDGEAS